MPSKSTPAPKFPRVLRYILFGIGVFVVGVLLTLGGVAYAYHDKFYPGVKVGGLVLSGKSQTAGTQLIDARVKQYLDHPVVVTVPKITEARNEATGQYPELEIPTTAAGLGISFREKEALDAAWQTGHQRNLWAWTKSAVQTLFAGIAHPLLYTIDQTQIATFIHTKVEPQVMTPTPAQVVVTGAQVTIADQKPGLTIDDTTLAAQLASSLASATDTDPTYLHAPATVTDSPVGRTQVEPIAAKLDQLGNSRVSLTTEGVALYPKREQILALFSPTQDDKGQLNVTVNQDAVSSYLDKNGRNILDQKKSLAAVTAALSNLIKADTSTAKNVSVSLVAKPVTVTAGAYTTGLFPGKYIQINLGEQKMYLINGDTLEQIFRVSSGKWSTPTPTTQPGEHFHVANKSRVAWSAEFGLYMPYWQNFVDDNGRLPAGDFGLHGLPYWPNGYKEGENDIGTPVSHGCVRVGAGNDEFLFNWTEIGTPIIIQQ